MDEYNSLPKRKHPRLKSYDYSTPNYYFVTICTNDKQCIFGKPSSLNSFGKIAEEGLLRIPSHFPGVRLDKYVVMPNHVHVILALSDFDTYLSVVVGQYKAYVTKRIHEWNAERKIWQKSYHDRVIRNQAEYEKIWKYIDENPQKWEDDCYF